MKIILRLTLAGMIIGLSALNGISQSVTFSRVYNFGIPSYFFSAQQTADSGYVAVGYIKKNYEDAYVMKLNKFGDTIWTKSYGGLYRDWAREIQPTSDGGYIIAGRRNYHTNMEYGNMYGDVWILKLNAGGDTLWTKTYGGPYNDFANSLRQTFDGGYVVAGAKNNHMINTASNSWILKLDQHGDTVWTKTFPSSGLSEAKAIIQTQDSGFVFTGTGVVCKLSSSGEIRWRSQLDSFIGNDIIQTSDSGFVTVGFSNNSDDRIVKLGPDGNTIWDYRNPPYWGYCYESKSLTLDGEGYIVSVGQRVKLNDLKDVPSDFYVAKRRPNGFYDVTISDDRYLHEIAHSVEPTSDKGYIIAGAVNGNAWLLKTDEKFRFQQNADSLCNLIEGDWYLTIRCNGFTGYCEPVYLGDLNRFERIAGTDSVVWTVFHEGELKYRNSYKVTYSGSNIYRTYRWMFEQDGNALMIISYTDPDKLSIVYDMADGGGDGFSRNRLVMGNVNDGKRLLKLSFSPNPAQDGFYIGGLQGIATVQLIDLNGRLLRSRAIEPNEWVDLSALPSGVYIVRVMRAEQTWIGKIVKA